LEEERQRVQRMTAGCKKAGQKKEDEKQGMQRHGLAKKEKKKVVRKGGNKMEGRLKYSW
jgi:hypothetical protein